MKPITFEDTPEMIYVRECLLEAQDQLQVSERVHELIIDFGTPLSAWQQEHNCSGVITADILSHIYVDREEADGNLDYNILERVFNYSGWAHLIDISALFGAFDLKYPSAYEGSEGFDMQIEEMVREIGSYEMNIKNAETNSAIFSDKEIARFLFKRNTYRGMLLMTFGFDTVSSSLVFPLEGTEWKEATLFTGCFDEDHDTIIIFLDK